MNIFSYIFGCRHEHHTWPQKPKLWNPITGQRRPVAAEVTDHYICCLDCGAELPYDLGNMRILASKRQERAYLKGTINAESC